MTGKIHALVLTGFGLNCDLETAHALELAGAEAVRVHINALIDGDARLDDYQILAFGGGFSWGDDHGAGVLQAVRLRTNVGDQLRAFVESQRLVIGICNGFQTLVNLGLLPGFDGDYQTRSVALTFNDCGNFRDDWVTLKIDIRSPCVFTKGLDVIDLPIRHGEGKFVTAPEVIAQLEAHHHAAPGLSADAQRQPALGGSYRGRARGKDAQVAGWPDAAARRASNVHDGGVTCRSRAARQ